MYDAYIRLRYCSLISSTLVSRGGAGAAGISKGRLSQELSVFFLQDALQVCRDANISREPLDLGKHYIFQSRLALKQNKKARMNAGNA